MTCMPHGILNKSKLKKITHQCGTSSH